MHPVEQFTKNANKMCAVNGIGQNEITILRQKTSSEKEFKPENKTEKWLIKGYGWRMVEKNNKNNQNKQTEWKKDIQNINSALI